MASELFIPDFLGSAKGKRPRVVLNSDRYSETDVTTALAHLMRSLTIIQSEVMTRFYGLGLRIDPSMRENPSDRLPMVKDVAYASIQTSLEVQRALGWNTQNPDERFHYAVSAARAKIRSRVHPLVQPYWQLCDGKPLTEPLEQSKDAPWEKLALTETSLTEHAALIEGLESNNIFTVKDLLEKDLGELLRCLKNINSAAKARRVGHIVTALDEVGVPKDQIPFYFCHGAKQSTMCKRIDALIRSGDVCETYRKKFEQPAIVDGRKESTTPSEQEIEAYFSSQKFLQTLCGIAGVPFDATLHEKYRPGEIIAAVQALLRSLPRDEAMALSARFGLCFMEDREESSGKTPTFPLPLVVDPMNASCRGMSLSQVRKCYFPHMVSSRGERIRQKINRTLEKVRNEDHTKHPSRAAFLAIVRGDDLPEDHCDQSDIPHAHHALAEVPHLRNQVNLLNSLEHGGIYTVGQGASTSINDLWMIYGFGWDSMERLVEGLESAGVPRSKILAIQ